MKITLEWSVEFCAYRCVITDDMHEYSVLRKSKDGCIDYVNQVKESRPDIKEWSYV